MRYDCKVYPLPNKVVIISYSLLTLLSFSTIILWKSHQHDDVYGPKANHILEKETAATELSERDNSRASYNPDATTMGQGHAGTAVPTYPERSYNHGAV